MRTIYTPSMIDAATVAKLWQDAIIVFDTCALLDFYYMTPVNQEVMADILSHLSDRIWLPAQVVYEFNKNRESAMTKPVSEKYQDKDIQNNRLVDDLKAYIGQWEKEYYHPFISPQCLQEIKDALAVIESKMAEIKTIVSKEYQARKHEIKDIRNKDVIEESVQSLNHGEPFTYSKVKEICKEGVYRYANKIPPGYKDAETKSDIRQYGDLIIWKEILQYAHDEHHDIIFVSNDTKADWVVADDRKNDPKAECPSPEELGHPRRELLAEFEEETGQAIWFYKTTDFIAKLEELYKPRQQEIAFFGKLGVVRDVLERSEREREIKLHLIGDAILVRCSTCGELFPFGAGDMNFAWEGDVVDDRGMGYEMEHESQEICFCPNCNKQIDLTLQVWEYPVGVFNTQNIEIEGGEIEEPMDLSHYIRLDDYEECWKCGERAILNEHRLCDQCEEEFRRFVESDD